MATNNEKKTTNANEINLLKKELQERDKTINDLTNSMDSLKAQLDILMKSMQQQPNIKDDDRDIEVFCRTFYPVTLSAMNDQKKFTIQGMGSAYININELKLFLRDTTSGSLTLFKNDILYFKDESLYEELKIKKEIDLSDENIIKIITMEDTNEMINKVAELTNYKVNFAVLHAFQYLVVKLTLDKNKPLKNWSYENRRILESYIGQKFDDLSRAINAYDMICLGKKRF